MKREAEEKQNKARKYVAPADGFWSRFPKLAEYLSDQFWEDGAARDTPQLSIRLFQENCIVSIVDLEKRRATQTTAATLQEALTLVEALCAAPPLPWRYWGAKKGK